MAEKKQTQSKVPATTNQNGSRGKKQHSNEKTTKYEQLEVIPLQFQDLSGSIQE